ncbi:TetR/AcrR family transcriptional regulator [Glycomyces arizonensis]|uniref:TetR/AcrR family transcriptional regulator n=1 Tax=Glycomyces arizonensis TaxID=256035 RepID=UPI000400003A|nr:TetR/AcrR family transcriptional regulator [Glycomyces arizonensis]
MEEELGLRERKKRATWSLLMSTALDMFEERGYDNVSVAEIAAEAGVSKATVFNYFPSKEELVVGGAKSHTEEPARLVRDRAVGETPHAVMRDYFLRALERREPLSGLCDEPLVLQVHRVARANPGLSLRLMDYRRQASVMLAEQLIAEGGSELTSNLVASQLLHVQYILAQGNVRRIYAGESIDAIYPGAVATAEHAFRLLQYGIGDFMRRDAEPRGAVDAAFHDTGPSAEADRCVEYASSGPCAHGESGQALPGAEDER